MTIDVDIELIKKIDILGATIFALISRLQQDSFSCRITQVEIADRLNIAKSTVSNRIKKLIDLNLINYEPRYKRYTITTKAKNN